MVTYLADFISFALWNRPDLEDGGTSASFKSRSARWSAWSFLALQNGIHFFSVLRLCCGCITKRNDDFDVCDFQKSHAGILPFLQIERHLTLGWCWNRVQHHFEISTSIDDLMKDILINQWIDVSGIKPQDARGDESQKVVCSCFLVMADIGSNLRQIHFLLNSFSQCLSSLSPSIYSLTARSQRWKGTLRFWHVIWQAFRTFCFDLVPLYPKDRLRAFLFISIVSTRQSPWFLSRYLCSLRSSTGHPSFSSQNTQFGPLFKLILSDYLPEESFVARIIDRSPFVAFSGWGDVAIYVSRTSICNQ